METFCTVQSKREMEAVLKERNFRAKMEKVECYR